MTAIFLKLLNMSITASWLVIAVLVIRSVFRKIPKWIHCLLWAMVAIRLLLPFSWEFAFSQIPSAEVIPPSILETDTPAIYSGIPAVNNTINPILTQQAIQGGDLLRTILSRASVIWLAGVLILLLYSTITYLRLYQQVKFSLPFAGNIYQCDNIATPFIFGFFRPKIYLPFGITAEARAHVLSHERAHIRRRDHWWKPLGFLLLTIYWFNPLLWAGYILLCRDIELACDEKVIAGMDNAYKKSYAETLLACSVHRRWITACPVAFGEVSVKTRIKGILRYKKTGFWIVLVSVAMCIVTALCFLSNPKDCKHVYFGDVLVNPTCTQVGIETRTCMFCRHSYTAPVALLAHDFDDGVMTRIPTCVQTGVQEQTCKECHYVHAESLPKNESHRMTETVQLAATCTAVGEGIKSCALCGYAEACSYPQISHNWVDGMTIQANCAMEGSQQILCTGCGAERWYDLPKTDNHTWYQFSPYMYEECALCDAINRDSQPEYTNPPSYVSPFTYSERNLIQYHDPFANLDPTPTLPSFSTNKSNSTQSQTPKLPVIRIFP